MDEERCAMNEEKADPLHSPSAVSPSPSPRLITWRSVLLGLAGVVFINALTYYNDYALAGTFLVGNFLPIGLLLFFLVLLLGVNAPLCRWAPRHALAGGELAVALGMALVSCAIPSSGLMRYLPGSLVAMHYQAGGSREYADLLRNLQLPDWLFPRFESNDVLQRANEDVVQHYWFRAPVAQDTPGAHWQAVPWGRWITPFVAWGLLVALLWGAVLCLCAIVRRQWVENERLPFPLATVWLSLIEPPPPGRALNSLFSARRFWIAAGAVFAVHSLNMLATYFPKYVPSLPLTYNMVSVLADTPLRFTDWNTFRISTLYFSVVGISFFLQTKVAFSLWAFYVMYQGAKVWAGTYQLDIRGGMLQDQSLGAMLVFVLAIAWIGRHHWCLVLRQMARGARGDEPRGLYLPYAAAGWGLVLCLAGVIAWLKLAGMSLLPAVGLVVLLMATFVVVARVVAETGLIFVQFPPTLTRPWIYAIGGMSTAARLGEARSFFFTNWFQMIFTHDLRESLSVYGTHALRVADESAQATRRRRAWGLMLCLGLALGAGYGVAWVSTLYVEYSHAVTLSAHPYGPINMYGVEAAPRELLRSTVEALPPNAGPAEPYSRTGHFLFGAGLTAGLSSLRLRFANWPLHPVGFLLAYTYPIAVIWFSVMVGWLAKVLIVRFGGARLYRSSRATFIGAIVGEASAAAFWLIVGLGLHLLGLPYYSRRFLPA
jgi:hypothetical protein